MPDKELVIKQQRIEEALTDAVRQRNEARTLAEDSISRMARDLATADMDELDPNALRAQADTLADQVARYRERVEFVRVLQKLMG